MELAQKLNALSSHFVATSFRNGMVKRAEFTNGRLSQESDLELQPKKMELYNFFA